MRFLDYLPTAAQTFVNPSRSRSNRLDKENNLDAGRGLLTNSPRLWCLAFTILALTCSGSGFAQAPIDTPGTTLEAALPDTPEPQQPAQPFAPKAQQMAIAPLPPARKYAEVIEPGQTAQRFTAWEKLVFSMTLVARPITLLPGLYSAGYEQLFNTDPKYGHDAGAFGDKLGSAMLRSASMRLFSYGILAGAFHQDPRYYRIAHGGIIHRGLLSARQALIRRGDDGTNQFNYSGIGGRAAAAVLTLTYYPEPSVNARVVVSTFLTSIVTDAGGNLVVEFLPSIVHKFPIMQKLRLE